MIVTKTISNPKKLTSVVQKIALQINCKLGGELWGCNNPLKGIMVVGIDTFHDPMRKGASVGGLVASVNQGFTKWYSKACYQVR